MREMLAVCTTFGEQGRLTGHAFTTGTGLNYMDARYGGGKKQRLSRGRIPVLDPQWVQAV